MNADTLPPILVVDDSATDVFFLCHRLTAAGINNPIHHVEDGVEATRWLEERLAAETANPPPVRLVFLDLKMPRMDGFAVLQWLQERGLVERMTVIVLTTSDDPADMQRATALGARGFLVKYPKVADLARLNALALQRATVTSA